MATTKRKIAKSNIVVTVEQFAAMDSSKICRIMNKDRAYAIIGNRSGKDRHIIDRSIK